jgi:glycosyltransferase involved in cell wall biosynthesis
MPPLVTVVTPVLNGARFLPQALDSVRRQDYPRVEHIVVDGGSTDGTLEILASAPGIAWTTAPDGGMYDAINRGFRMAKGDMIGYLNADDRYVAPDAISTLAGHLAEQPEVDVVYGDFEYIDEEGRVLERARVRDFDPRVLGHYSFVPPHATLVRRRVVTEEGHWLDATLRFPGDWDWFVGMARAGKRFAHVDRVVSQFRSHPHSLSATLGIVARMSEVRRVCRKRRTSFLLTLWYEALYVPLRRRIGLRP